MPCANLEEGSLAGLDSELVGQFRHEKSKERALLEKLGLFHQGRIRSETNFLEFDGNAG
jgi:hypothetical protein